MPDRMFLISRCGDMSPCGSWTEFEKGSLKKKKKKILGDWTNFLSITFKTDWLDFFYTASCWRSLAFVTTKPRLFLLKGCRLVPSYSDRVRMYQMGSFKAGSARLQTWKHPDPAALHWFGAGSIMKNISVVLIRWSFNLFISRVTERVTKPLV